MYKYEINWELDVLQRYFCRKTQSKKSKIVKNSGSEIYYSEKELEDWEFDKILENWVHSPEIVDNDFTILVNMYGGNIENFKVKNFILLYSGNSDQEINKVFDKIQKLLNLSLSDNEHEAALASSRAVNLMQKHSITRDDLNRQQHVVKLEETPFYRIPEWYTNLYSQMGRVSGCFVLWRNGNSGKDSFKEKKAMLKIIGKERDVLNASYLISIFIREIEKSTKKFKEENPEANRIDVSSFKCGMVDGLFKRLDNSKKDYFNDVIKKGELVPVDLESRIDEARKFF